MTGSFDEYMSVLDELHQTISIAEDKRAQNFFDNHEIFNSTDDLSLEAGEPEKTELHYDSADVGVKLSDFLLPQNPFGFSDETKKSSSENSKVRVSNENKPQNTPPETDFSPLNASEQTSSPLNKTTENTEKEFFPEDDKTVEFSLSDLALLEMQAGETNHHNHEIPDFPANDFTTKEVVPNYRTNPELFIEAMLNFDGQIVSIEDKYLIYILDNNFFAFPAANVAEISRPLPVAPLPGAPHWLLGISNLRGEVVPILSLRYFWGKPFDYAVTKPKIIILRSKREEFMVGIMVDQVREIRHLPIEKIFPSPEKHDSFIEVCLQGISEYEVGKPLLHLDAERFLSLPRLRNLD